MDPKWRIVNAAAIFFGNFLRPYVTLHSFNCQNGPNVYDPSTFQMDFHPTTDVDAALGAKDSIDI